MKVAREITLASFRKRIHSSQLGRIYARFEGKASLAFETDDAANVELTIAKDAELAFDDLFFGARGTLKVTGDKLEYGLGTDDFSVQFDPLSLHPLSFHLATNNTFALEKELPQLGLKGTAEVEVEITIEFIPDYVRLATTLRGFILQTKDSLCRIAGKVARRLIYRAGRTAIYAPFRMLGTSIGRNLALSMMRLGSKTSVLRSLVSRTAGRLLGPIGIVIESERIVKAGIEGPLKIVHRRVIDALNGWFILAYAVFLAEMTVESNRSGNFPEHRFTIDRVNSNPPDIYGVVEHLARYQKVVEPNIHAGDWVKNQIAAGVSFKAQEIVSSQVDWQDLYRVAYNLQFLFGDANLMSNSRRKTESLKGVQGAQNLAAAAGVVAAYQDIEAFVTMSSIYEDLSGVQPSDVWAEWNKVAAFHRQVFGDHVPVRLANYVTLIDKMTLSIAIPPFADFG